MSKVIKPTFNMLLKINEIPYYKIIIAILGFEFSIFEISEATTLSANSKTWLFTITNCVIFIAWITYEYLLYRKTTYTLNSQRAIYDFNFLWREHKEILLVNVKDMELKMSFLQRLFNLGNIVLSTQAQVGASNMIIKNIKHPEELYTLLKEYVAEAQSGSLSSVPPMV